MDRISPEKRSWNMSRIRGENTKPEIIVRSLLHRNGYRFRLHKKDLPGKPDIVLPKHKIVVLVNGCFWHQHKNCSNSNIPKTNTKFWRDKLKKNVLRDIEKKAELRKLGWRIYTVWECQLIDLEKIEKKLKIFIEGT